MTDHDTNPEKGTTPEGTSGEKSLEGGKQLSKRAMLIIVGIVLALVVALYFFLTSGGNVSEEPATQDPPPVSETPSVSQPTVVGEADTSPNSDIDEDTQLDPVQEDEKHGPNPYDENGTEYIMTEASQKEWRPIRAKFITGLLGDGNIAEAVQGTATEEVMEDLKNQPPGAYKDAVPEELDIHDVFDERVSAYEYTEAMRLESGKWLYVTIASYDDKGKDTFRVSAYKIVDEGEAGHDHEHEEGE